MNTTDTSASSFIDMLKDELRKIRDAKGEQAATLSKNSFNSIQLLSLMSLLTQGHDDDDYQQRVEFVMNGAGEIVSIFLSDLSEGMTEEDTDQAMRFADRMNEIRQSMMQRTGAVLQ